MPPAAKQPANKTISIKIADEPASYRWQMMFNAFAIEKLDHGCMIRFAWLSRGTAAEIVPIFVPNEGVENLRSTSSEYVKQFGEVEPRPRDVLPDVRQFSPLFANQLSLAWSGGSAEIGFNTVQLNDIANASRGKLKSDASVHSVKVALMHSDVLTHKQFVVSLLTA